MKNKYDNYGDKEKPKEKPVIEEEIENAPAEDPFTKYPVLIAKSPAPANKQEETKLPAADHKDQEIKSAQIDDLMLDLNSLVGLDRVKSEIFALLQFVKVQELRRQKEISTAKPTLHSVFYGSPGTGKTTVARLYGKMLSAMGLLSKGHLIETDRSDLIGGYIGQTAIKTDEKIEEALGGILFIDEAYSLAKGDDSKWDYGDEAIAVLLKRMEDFRDDFVVIVAGYPDPMSKFLESNEGLKSRFNSFIHFDDYSPTELAEIFRRICEKENYSPTDEALDFAFTAIDYNYSIKDKSFGNARFVRNLFEIVIRNQAIRIASAEGSPSEEDLRVIIPDDIPFVTSAAPEKRIVKDKKGGLNNEQP